jgi:hypothetical protein
MPFKKYQGLQEVHQVNDYKLLELSLKVFQLEREIAVQERLLRACEGNPIENPEIISIKSKIATLKSDQNKIKKLIASNN